MVRISACSLKGLEICGPQKVDDPCFKTLRGPNSLYYLNLFIVAHYAELSSSLHLSLVLADIGVYMVHVNFTVIFWPTATGGCQLFSFSFHFPIFRLTHECINCKIFPAAYNAL